MSDWHLCDEIVMRNNIMCSFETITSTDYILYISSNRLRSTSNNDIDIIQRIRQANLIVEHLHVGYMDDFVNIRIGSQQRINLSLNDF